MQEKREAAGVREEDDNSQFSQEKEPILKGAIDWNDPSSAFLLFYTTWSSKT